jgi:hypothetical protein
MTDSITHGKFSVTPQGEVLLCEIQGAWNKEGSEQLIEDLKAVVQGFAGKKWVRVMDMQGWELATPDAISMMTNFSSWEDQHGCVLRCFIG